MANQSLVFIGIAGRVVALNRTSGEIVWQSRFKGGNFVSLAVQDGDVYAATKGEVFCLDPATGNIRWSNRLTGLGLGLVSIATTGGQQTAVLGQEYSSVESG